MLLDAFTQNRMTTIRDVRRWAHLREDFTHLMRGALDWKSFISGYLPHRDSVQVVVRDKHGKLKDLRYTHNQVTTAGQNTWQRLAMFGNLSANATFATCIGAATSTGTTSLTNTGASFPTTGGVNGGLQGQIVVAMSSGTAVAWGVIMSNTSTVLTVDRRCYHGVCSRLLAERRSERDTARYHVDCLNRAPTTASLDCPFISFGRAG